MKEQIIVCIEKVKPDFKKYAEDVNVKDFIEEGIFDSFDVMNIIANIEDDFGIEIEPEDVLPENFATLDAIVALVEKTKNQ